MPEKKRYAIVGVGSRSRMYLKAVQETYADTAELVAACDRNRGRLELVNAERADAGLDPVALYSDRQFDRMVSQTGPDTVIVTTKDSFHDKYICRALELGCNAVTEKPMTTDEAKCQRIVDTAKATGGDVRVTFNYRYAPPRTQLKDLLMSGAIGRVLSVDFHWLLDTRHGADYFRRWHRYKRNSGTLLVHKATHHFDLMNWWLSARPTEVVARGARRFYRPETAERYGLTKRADRCLVCPEKEKCNFSLDLEGNEKLKALYLDNEHHDGYFRDRCVWAGDIDIYDTMNLAVTYDTGAFMSFSLNAFCPKEGYEIRFNGTRGRIEHTTLESSYVSGAGKDDQQHQTIKQATSTWVYPHFEDPYEVEVATGKGSHGGGDRVLLDDIFLPDPPEDKYKRAADWGQGALSILTGIAAYKSIATGDPVKVDTLVSGVPDPDFPEMPEW